MNIKKITPTIKININSVPNFRALFLWSFQGICVRSLKFHWLIIKQFTFNITGNIILVLNILLTIFITIVLKYYMPVTDILVPIT